MTSGCPRYAPRLPVLRLAAAPPCFYTRHPPPSGTVARRSSPADTRPPSCTLARRSSPPIFTRAPPPPVLWLSGAPGQGLQGRREGHQRLRRRAARRRARLVASQLQWCESSSPAGTAPTPIADLLIR